MTLLVDKAFFIIFQIDSLEDSLYQINYLVCLNMNQKQNTKKFIFYVFYGIISLKETPRKSPKISVL